MGVIYFVPVEDCNLRCRHCYVFAGKSDGADRNEKYFSPSLLGQLERYLEVYIRRYGAGHFVFHGGEPLLADMEFLERVRILVTGMGFSCGIQTNLVHNLFNRKTGSPENTGLFLLKFESIGTSLDIFREKYADRILSNARWLAKHGKYVSFMVTVTEDTDPDLFRSFLSEIEKGHRETGRFSFRLVLEHPWESTRPFVSLELFRELFGHVLTLNSFEARVRKQPGNENIPCQNRVSFCSPVYGGNCLFEGVRVISPRGELFFCPDNLGKKEFSIGDIFTEERIRFGFFSEYVEHRKEVIRSCSGMDCFRACRGGCFQLSLINYFRGGSLFDPYCEHYRYVLSVISGSGRKNIFIHSSTEVPSRNES